MADEIDIDRLGALTGSVPKKPARGRGFTDPEVVARAVAKSVRTRKRKAKKRQAERKRKYEQPAIRGKGNKARMRYVIPLWQVLVCRMEPGEWYALADLCRLMAASDKAVWCRLRDNRRRGLIERAPDPDWRPSFGFPARMRPRHLFRLTAKAARLREVWQERLREGDGCGE